MIVLLSLVVGPHHQKIKKQEVYNNYKDLSRGAYRESAERVPGNWKPSTGSSKIGNF